MNEERKLTRNPSRETCENIIRRILITEVLENGSNTHFRQASDFMSYFESLYPASDSLTKQVQRAIKSMDMPKDQNGYFIINRSKEQFAQETELKYITQKGCCILDSMEQCETVFIKVSDGFSDYLIHALCSWELLQDKYITMTKTCNGILIYTKDKSKLTSLIESIIS